MFKTAIQKLLIAALAVILPAGLLLGGCSPASEEDYGHEHGDQPYEWSAVYELPADIYTLEFLDSPHDDSILVAFLSEGPAQEDLEHMAHHIIEAPAEEIAAGGSFHAEDQYAYDLQLNPDGTVFTFEITEGKRYVIFTEHFAWEFDMRIYDSTGQEIVGENPTDHAEEHTH